MDFVFPDSDFDLGIGALMRKRLRKKLHLGEFAQLGFELEFSLDVPKNAPSGIGGFVNKWIDRWIDFLDNNRMSAGGGICGKEAHWVVQGAERYKSTTLSDRERCVEWLSENGANTIHASPLFDLWYDDLPLTEAP